MEHMYKLVRDRIGDIPWGTEEDKKYLRSVGSQAEHEFLLREKLREEVLELEIDLDLHDNPGPDEFADVLEVLRALAQNANLAWDNIERRRLEKRNERGGFIHGMVYEGPVP